MSKRAQARARAAREVLAARRAAERRRRTVLVSAAVGVLLLVAGVIGYAVYVTQQPQQVTAPRHTAQDKSGLRLGDGPVTVNLYVDFLCPHCQVYEQQAGPTLRRYLDEDRITLVYHPLSILDRMSTTDYSTRAGAATAAAADEGKLWEYAEALFAHQPTEGGPGLSDDELIELGRSVGITSGEFAAAVNNDRYHDWITYATEQADQRGVRGTPTVYVNGEPVEPTVTALKTAVDRS